MSVEIVIPYAGEDAFEVRDRDGQTDLFFATPAAALVAREAGNDLVMVAGLQRDFGLQLWSRSTRAPTLSELKGGSILVQGRPGDQAPLLAALAAVGVQPTDVEIAFLDDPSLPFDPYALFDGTFTATAVTRYDGAARLQEFYDLETGLPVGPEGTVEVVDDVFHLAFGQLRVVLELHHAVLAAHALLDGPPTVASFDRGLDRVPVDEAEAGDIVAIAGMGVTLLGVYLVVAKK